MAIPQDDWCFHNIEIFIKSLNWAQTIIWLFGLILAIILIIYFIQSKIKKEKFFGEKSKKAFVLLIGPFLSFAIISIVEVMTDSNQEYMSIIRGITPIIAVFIGGLSMTIIGKMLKLFKKKNVSFIVEIIFYWLIMAIMVFLLIMGMRSAAIYCNPDNNLLGVNI